MRPSSPFYPVPSVLPFVVLCASRFVHSFVFCLSSNEVLKDNNAVDATSVTTLYLTHKALSDITCLTVNLEKLDLKLNNLTSLELLNGAQNKVPAYLGGIFVCVSFVVALVSLGHSWMLS
ncbi:uncharacterized protein LOC114414212 [Glycine soja]|uniref:uncharacterized protein LOC114414212 n=1 Tax=Glycine soja TaxID=3848 RepID=UPI00103C3007|nr:uncharacterized protein LOC114414212 [Glycine soja]KAG5047258.1 hypothetical protein JHK86_016664 [Glycine max]